MIDHSQIVDAVIRDYIGILQRVPDKGGLNFWVDAVESGKMTLDGVVSAISEFLPSNLDYGGASGSSPVTIGSIHTMYHFALGKEPEPSALDFWLHAGINNAQLFNVVLNTSNFIEAAAPTVAQYNTYLSTGFWPSSDMPLQPTSIAGLAAYQHPVQDPGTGLIG